jgi:hypothetical protein
MLVFIILHFGVLSGLTQTVQQKSAPKDLVLKINFFKGKPAAHLSVPEVDGRTGGAWYALFQKIPNWQPPAGALPVRAVNIVPRLDGDAVKVTVSVFTGQRFHEKEEFVAVYSIRENESAEIKELSKFGVEPFEISVVRITPSVAALPVIVNKTSALEASAEPNYSTLPSYKIKLLNNSSKAVSAFTWGTFLGARPEVSSMPQGLEGRHLIEPGAIYETTIPSNFRFAKTSDESAAAAVEGETFMITAVIFEDGTFEGDIGKAATFLGFTLGRKSMLKQIVPLLQKASDTDFTNGELSRQISNLNATVDETALNEFLKRFPAFTDAAKPGLRGAAETAMRGVKKTILDQLQMFQANQKKIETTADWELIKATEEKYQNWLARLL